MGLDFYQKSHHDRSNRSLKMNHQLSLNQTNIIKENLRIKVFIGRKSTRLRRCLTKRILSLWYGSAQIKKALNLLDRLGAFVFVGFKCRVFI